ncbi:hypothetical protein BASA81_000861 [Batrachochytrium salamandrivorans]|nr:hypothetical protein BASA81_000861 [Batrachochytrium salamandrivorans]
MLSATNRPAEMRRKGTALSQTPTIPTARGVMATELQVQELIAFLDWKDPGQDNAEYSRRILGMHPLAEVGVAMRDKFKFLPAGWRTHVPFTATLPEVEPTVSDLKVDEIIDTEQRFLNVISEVLDTYVGELFKIYSSGDQNAIASLGLTLDEALLIFDRLQLTRQFSLLLLHELECINCIRAKPVLGEGRAVHVGQAFLKMAPRLYDLFAPAVVGYTEATRIVARATERINKQSRKTLSAFRLGGGAGGDKTTFLTLWDSVTSESQWLRQKQLGSVFITPMQRLTRYELLLSVLVKDCDHPEAVPVVEQALRVVSVAVAQINDSMLEQQDKVNEEEASKFGRGPSASESMESKSSIM